jgi:hypothetical protein
MADLSEKKREMEKATWVFYPKTKRIEANVMKVPPTLFHISPPNRLHHIPARS